VKLNANTLAKPIVRRIYTFVGMIEYANHTILSNIAVAMEEDQLAEFGVNVLTEWLTASLRFKTSNNV
jgi:hypothetical protein